MANSGFVPMPGPCTYNLRNTQQRGDQEGPVNPQPEQDPPPHPQVQDPQPEPQQLPDPQPEPDNQPEPQPEPNEEPQPEPQVFGMMNMNNHLNRDPFKGQGQDADKWFAYFELYTIFMNLNEQRAALALPFFLKGVAKILVWVTPRKLGET